ncbi:MAG: FtsX-like permease family protein [Thermoguttaceae bacterium]|nr:FtsX-like permease family protein [Planctomycetaceae bacterium]MBQ4143185.1 FtsX-like permease family protein [Thermoguttaceae bacterium]
MYKIFLCLRYLRTRYIVLASIISVMLGVATMIVVNSVMSGFANEMQTRIHGILGDIMVTSTTSDGFYDPEGQMQKIRDTLGDQVVGMTPICTTVGVLTYKTRILDAEGFEREAQLTEQVCIVGVDERSKGSVGDFGKFLQHPENRKQLSFDLREGGYDTFEGQKMTQSRGILNRFFPESSQKGPNGKVQERTDMKRAGWGHRREYYGDPLPGVEIITDPELHVETRNTASAELPTMKDAEQDEAEPLAIIDTTKPVSAPTDHPMDDPPEPPALPNETLAGSAKTPSPFDVAGDAEAPNAEITAAGGTDEHSAGSVNGESEENAEEDEYVPELAGSVAFPNAADDSFDPFGEPVGLTFDPMKETHPGIIVGIGMAMYRSAGGKDDFLLLPGRDVMLTFPDCNIRPEGVTGHFTCVDLYESKMSEYDGSFVFVPMSTLQELRGMPNKANQIQIQLREGADLDEACMKLQKVFDSQLFSCRTWRDDKMPLLQAVDMEIAILNVLLFMIIAVSGFGILAIFYMVVTDKTRDIGILKALGASSWGIMCIFLMYGLSLGIVGAGLGLVMGLVFVCNINEIADFLSWMLGREVFPPDIYYFYQIPYDISLSTVGWIVGGALLIAVLASVFPAWHASRLQPVESLRYE